MGTRSIQHSHTHSTVPHVPVPTKTKNTVGSQFSFFLRLQEQAEFACLGVVSGLNFNSERGECPLEGKEEWAGHFYYRTHVTHFTAGGRLIFPAADFNRGEEYLFCYLFVSCVYPVCALLNLSLGYFIYQFIHLLCINGYVFLSIFLYVYLSVSLYLSFIRLYF